MKIYLIAGEASGDLLGGGLMASLKAASPNIEFFGIGGDKMTAQGLPSLFAMNELTAMGLAEVVPRIPHFLRRIRQVADHIESVQPDAVITIDAPDFASRVAKILRKRKTNIRLVHYVAPTVWAWRPGRARHAAELYDQLLCLFPFEPPYFERHGLRADFIGHPIVQSMAGNGDATLFRAQHQIKENEKFLCVLPGSRTGEIKRLLPLFIETVRLMKKQSDFRWAVPTLPHTYDLVQSITSDFHDGPVLLRSEQQKFDCFAASTAALAASGSVALELAKASLPSIIAYRLNSVSAFLVKRLIRIPYANLINILLNKKIVPEFIQQDCTPEKMAAALSRLLNDDAQQRQQKVGYQQALQMLWPPDNTPPSKAAAAAILDGIENDKKNPG